MIEAGAAAERAARAAWATRPPLTVTAGATVDVHLSIGNEPEIDVLAPDELAAAAERAGIDLSAATAADGMALQGFVSALRGTAGERATLEGLLDGSLPAPSGASAARLEVHTLPGVDLTFTDVSGLTVGAANVKIAADPNVVVRHFERYADTVPLVYAPSDTAARLAGRGYRVLEPDEALGILIEPTVVSLGRPTEAFDGEVREALAGTVIDASTPLTDLVPWFGFAAVGVRATQRLAAGASWGDTGRQVGREALVASSASAVGHGTAAVAGGFAAVPGAIVGAWAAQAALEVRGDFRRTVQADQRLRRLLADLPARRR